MIVRSMKQLSSTATLDQVLEACTTNSLLVHNREAHTLYHKLIGPEGLGDADTNVPAHQDDIETINRIMSRDAGEQQRLAAAMDEAVNTSSTLEEMVNKYRAMV